MKRARSQRRRRDIFVESAGKQNPRPVRGRLPQLRAVTAERERAALQNAVTAPDQQIDQLVYELYNFTPEEIDLAEGAA